MCGGEIDTKRERAYVNLAPAVAERCDGVCVCVYAPRERECERDTDKEKD